MLDMFTEPVSLTYNGKDAQYRTKVGACFSILMMISLLTYGARKFLTMYTRQSIQISSHTEYNRIGETFTFNTNGTEFALAFGLSSYPVSQPTDLADYGSFVASYTRQTADTDG